MIEIEIPKIVLLIEAFVSSLFFFLSFITGVKNIILIKDNNLNTKKYFFVVNFPAFTGFVGGVIFLFIFVRDVVFNTPILSSSSFGTIFILPLVLLLSSEMAIRQKSIEQELKSLSDFKRKENKEWTYLDL